MVVEELQPRRLGCHFVDYLGYLLWLLLVEGHRYEPFDSLTMVEGYWSQGFWGVVTGCMAERTPWHNSEYPTGHSGDTGEASLLP